MKFRDWLNASSDKDIIKTFMSNIWWSRYCVLHFATRGTFRIRSDQYELSMISFSLHPRSSMLSMVPCYRHHQHKEGARKRWLTEGCHHTEKYPGHMKMFLEVGLWFKHWILKMRWLRNSTCKYFFLEQIGCKTLARDAMRMNIWDLFLKRQCCSICPGWIRLNPLLGKEVLPESWDSCSLALSLVHTSEVCF